MLRQKTNALVFLAFRQAWSSKAEARISALTFCKRRDGRAPPLDMEAERETERESEGEGEREREQEGGGREGKADAEYIVSFTLH